MIRNKLVRWRKHSFIFFRVGFEEWQKNESVFCAMAIEIQIIFLCVGGFLIIYFIAVAYQLAAVSSRLVGIKQLVQSPFVSVSTVANRVTDNSQIYESFLSYLKKLSFSI